MRLTVYAFVCLAVAGCATSKRTPPSEINDFIVREFSGIMNRSGGGCLATLPIAKDYLRKTYVYTDFVVYCDKATLVAAFDVPGMPETTHVRIKMVSR